MQIETEIEVKYKTTLGDSMDDDTDEQTQNDMVEQHIRDYCVEHKIDRTGVKVIK